MLVVNEIKPQGEISATNMASLLEQHTKTHTISCINWKNYPYKPKVQFNIAHTNTKIWLKFKVTEKDTRAEVTTTNGSVYEDSCVEFFFAPLADGNYYNFEFNALGTPHVAYGSNRNSRTLLPEELIKKQVNVITSYKTKKHQKTTSNNWELIVVIPVTLLIYSNIKQFKGLKAKGNFYKCGDKTAEKHFLSWQPISTKTPDFHQPNSFREIIF